MYVHVIKLLRIFNILFTILEGKTVSIIVSSLISLGNLEIRIIGQGLNLCRRSSSVSKVLAQHTIGPKFDSLTPPKPECIHRGLSFILTSAS